MPQEDGAFKFIFLLLDDDFTKSAKFLLFVILFICFCELCFCELYFNATTSLFVNFKLDGSKVPSFKLNWLLNPLPILELSSYGSIDNNLGIPSLPKPIKPWICFFERLKYHCS